MKSEKILEIFREKKIRATPQRIAVYQFLYDNRIHPCVNEIYEAVVKDNPSFSKTTVYNALSSLMEKGLVVPLAADENCIRYDARIDFHGHFYCKNCKKVFDFEIQAQKVSGLENFQVDVKDFSCTGICAECSKNN